MAGKRPDQHQIAPSEAGSTDYKRFPQKTHGQDGELGTTEDDKQRLASSKQDAQGQPFPPDVPAPSGAAHQAARERGKTEDDGGKE